MSQRRRAQMGLLCACVVLAGTIAIIYQGGNEPPRIGQQADVVFKRQPKPADAPPIANANPNR
jgi:hypothetical protein